VLNFNVFVAEFEGEGEDDGYLTSGEEYTDIGFAFLLEHLDSPVSYRILLHVQPRNDVGEYEGFIVEHLLNSLTGGIGDIFE